MFPVLCTWPAPCQSFGASPVGQVKPVDRETAVSTVMGFVVKRGIGRTMFPIRSSSDLNLCSFNCGQEDVVEQVTHDTKSLLQVLSSCLFKAYCRLCCIMRHRRRGIAWLHK